MPIRIDELLGDSTALEVARILANGVHQVDSPVFDQLGRLYVTQSGSRDTKVPVPLYRIGLDGVREPLAVEIANPTSLALGPDGDGLHLEPLRRTRSSADGRRPRRALCDGTGRADRPRVRARRHAVRGRSIGIDPSRVSRSGRSRRSRSLPASVAAFHLAFGPDGCLYVTAPTLATHDPVYRITPDRLVDVVCDGFGRPQGLAFDSSGALYVADALAGRCRPVPDRSRRRTVPSPSWCSARRCWSAWRSIRAAAWSSRRTTRSGSSTSSFER